MPREPRLLLSKSYYHVMTRGNNRNQVFVKAEDYDYFLSRISKYKSDHSFNLYHYCLMPNHTHFLIQTNDADDFAQFMKKLNLSYFHYYKKRYGWVGHFWQDRYKAQPVGKDEYFIQCGKYIELNPVRAKMVEKAEDYAYSSYGHYRLGQPNGLLTEDMFYDGLGDTVVERQNRYNKLVIGDMVAENYKKKVWSGSSSQKHNETEKIRFHHKKRNR